MDEISDLIQIKQGSVKGMLRDLKSLLVEAQVFQPRGLAMALILGIVFKNNKKWSFKYGFSMLRGLLKDYNRQAKQTKQTNRKGTLKCLNEVFKKNLRLRLQMFHKAAAQYKAHLTIFLKGIKTVSKLLKRIALSKWKLTCIYSKKPIKTPQTPIKYKKASPVRFCKTPKLSSDSSTQASSRSLHSLCKNLFFNSVVLPSPTSIHDYIDDFTELSHHNLKAVYQSKLNNSNYK